MTQPTLKTILATLSPTWPRNGITPEVIQAFTLALRGEDLSLIQAAAVEWVREEKWFPKPAELIIRAQIIASEQTRKDRKLIAGDDWQLADCLRIAAALQGMGMTNPHIQARIQQLQAQLRLVGAA